MNKPISRPEADPDIGPLDEHGQQIWSPEEEAAIARAWADPERLAALAEAEADIAAGRVRTQEEHVVWIEARKREWFTKRAL